MRKTVSRSAVVAAVILALAAPVWAGENVIQGASVIHKGVDIWMTVAGFAQTSFEKEPIPAGFFCVDSKPFTRCPRVHTPSGTFLTASLRRPRSSARSW